MGDVICAFPSIIALRERHPGAIFVYKVIPANAPLVEMGRVADWMLVEDWFHLRIRTHATDYDFTYAPLCEGERKTPLEPIHLVGDFLRDLGLESPPTQPRLYPERPAGHLVERRMKEIRARTKYIIGIQVGPTWKVKEWPAESWTQLVELLHSSLDCVVIQLGANFHIQMGEVQTPKIPGCEDWVGQLDIRECAWAIQQLDLFIGIDSGLLHLAGAVSTRCVGLYGPTDPKYFLPLEGTGIGVTSTVACLGCHHRYPRLHWMDNCPFQIACMKELSPFAVLEAVREALSFRSISTT